MKFERLIVIEQGEDYIAPKSQKHFKQYLCQCDCGTIKNVPAESLRRGESQSCGCY